MIENSCNLDEISLSGSHGPGTRSLKGVGKNWLKIVESEGEIFIFMLSNDFIKDDALLIFPLEDEPQTIIISSLESDYDVAIPAYSEILSAKKINLFLILKTKERAIKDTISFFSPAISSELPGLIKSSNHIFRVGKHYIENNIDSSILKLIEGEEISFLDCYFHNYNKNNFKKIKIKKIGG